MSTVDEIIALERAAHAAGFRVADILRAAKLDRSTWTRWRNGVTSPRLDNWKAVHQAVKDLIASRHEAA